MPPDVLEHAFEPFFTTKPHGHGTGLGLSMVFGFVRQSGGHTLIESELGRGTTVSLFFPRCCEPETAEAADETSAPVGGGETVLVVEDDADVRLTAVEMLVQLGYKVLTASSGDAALEFIDSDVPIDLLFTDVVMPGKIKSVELARRAAARSPSVPTLFTSGYTRDEIVHHGKLDAGITLLSKPYRRDDLARKVRGVLRAAAGGAGGTAAVGKMTDREIAACVPSVAYDPASGDASGVATSGVATSGVDAPGLATPLTPTPKAAANESESASTDAPARSPAHVLLVEDDADSREALSCLLGALGLDCTSVGSAEEALPLLPAQRYDILFTDITLPGMSGDNLARAVLREQPDVQVLLVSGYGAQAPIGERIPGARLLGKPFDLAQLRRELAQWVNPIEAAS